MMDFLTFDLDSRLGHTILQAEEIVLVHQTQQFLSFDQMAFNTNETIRIDSNLLEDNLEHGYKQPLMIGLDRCSIINAIGQDWPIFPLLKQSDDPLVGEEPIVCPIESGADDITQLFKQSIPNIAEEDSTDENFSLLLNQSIEPLPEEPSIVFPTDSGVINVTRAPYGAIPNDGKDDTAAIQKALSEVANANRIIYLPDGTYLVSDRLEWPAGNQGGSEHKRTILQGQSREGTIIQLQDNAPAYQDPNNPLAVVWTGTKPAQRFRNTIRDLTINTGVGNPGAIGLQFIANNQGGIRNVAIVSGDGQGQVGLDMKYTDEIGPLYVKGLSINGFDYGIQTYWQTASITFEDVSLENQNILGWENDGQTIFIRGLKSTNEVTVLKNVKDAPSSVTLIDANLIGMGSAVMVPAILNQKSMFLRNVETSGYSMAVEQDDKGRGNEPGVIEPTINEWISHGKQPDSLFSSPDVSLNLPIRDLPIVPWDALEDWVSPLQFGGKPNDSIDDTAAIQAAIDSGATTVYLSNGTWNIQSTLNLRGNVHRFLGTEARLLGTGTRARIRVSDNIPPAVQIERLDMQGRIDIIHASEKNLVLSSLTLAGRYRNIDRPDIGDLFIEDVVGGPFYFLKQDVWARQLNQETDTQATSDLAKVVNDGGNLWILGIKTERPGTIIQTMNGGKTEVIGGYIFSTGGSKIEPAFINDNSSLSLAGVVERNFNGYPFAQWVKETRDGQTRVLSSQGITAPLYVGYETSIP